MKAKVALFIVSLLLLTAGCATTTTNVKNEKQKLYREVTDQVKRIEAFIREDKRDEISKEYFYKSERDRSNQILRFLYAWTLSDNDRAMKIFTKMMRTKKNEPWGYVGAAKILIDWKVLDQAEQKLKTALKIAPEFYVIYLLLGRLEFKKGNLKKAREYLNQVLKMDPAFLDAHVEMGILYLRSKEINKAEASFKEALKISATDFRANLELGKIKEMKGEYEEAEKYLKKAYEVDDSNLELILHLARVLRKLGKVDESIVFYERAYQKNPDDLKILKTMAEIYKKAGRLDDELGILLRLEQSNYKGTDMFNRIASIYEKKGDIKKQIEYLKKTVDEDPEDYEAFLMLSIALEKEKNLRESMENAYVVITAKNAEEDIKKRAEEQFWKIGDKIMLSRKPVKGRTPTHIYNAIARRVLKLYKERLKENPELKGKFILKIRVSKDGEVKNIEITTNTLKDPFMEASIYWHARLAKFPAPGKDIFYDFPYNFLPPR